VFVASVSALPPASMPAPGPQRPGVAVGPRVSPGATPLLGGQPEAEDPAGMAAHAPPPTPVVFDGGPAGSPSLAVPVAE
jgi:hypothetical protein